MEKEETPCTHSLYVLFAFLYLFFCFLFFFHLSPLCFPFPTSLLPPPPPRLKVVVARFVQGSPCFFRSGPHTDTCMSYPSESNLHYLTIFRLTAPKPHPAPPPPLCPTFFPGLPNLMTNSTHATRRTPRVYMWIREVNVDARPIPNVRGGPSFSFPPSAVGNPTSHNPANPRPPHTPSQFGYWAYF